VIGLTRDSAAVHASYCGHKRIAAERALLALRRSGQDPSTTFWKVAKRQLKAESAGKCGYCEGLTTQTAHGDVEHYRPKADYWWLAYCYENYIYACQICNQTYKKTNFPIAGTRLAEPPLLPMSTDEDLDALAGTLGPDPLDTAGVIAFQAAARAELAHIPDPYADDPERLFVWKADDTLGEVEIQPRDGSPEALRAFRAAVDFLGLNRQELKGSRYATYAPAALFVRTLKAGVIDAELTRDIEQQLRRMMSPSGQFAGMVRYFVNEVEGLAL
jgi:hypothetical protein